MEVKWGNKTSLGVFFFCFVLMVCIFRNFKFSTRYIPVRLRYRLTKLTEKNSQEENMVMFFMAAFFSRGDLKM